MYTKSKVRRKCMVAIKTRFKQTFCRCFDIPTNTVPTHAATAIAVVNQTNKDNTNNSDSGALISRSSISTPSTSMSVSVSTSACHCGMSDQRAEILARYCEPLLWQRHPPTPPPTIKTTPRPSSLSSSVGMMMNAVNINSNVGKARLRASSSYSKHARQLVQYLETLSSSPSPATTASLQVRLLLIPQQQQSVDSLDMITMKELDRILTLSARVGLTTTPTAISTVASPLPLL
jgi:hypothetical protein